MSNAIIQVRNLGKSYNIPHEVGKESYTALRDVVINHTKKIFSFPKYLRSENNRSKSSIEEFWALKDVSFDIKQGDRVGIIGSNGAGKSTLLKILSRITEPAAGEIKIKGRVASLLEVGTGFHPELTGRENIYLNGAILGMSRAEIKRKFDEIIDFAEVEKFLDTPVKRYSSGMYVRLAFAVAAHLEPEILVIDEVLAVGDAQFQKKCLGKMEDVSKNEGRTVLFVSHSMPTISSLCNRGILFEKGKISVDAEVGKAILAYYSSDNASPTYSDFTNGKKYIGDTFSRLLNAGIFIDGQISNSEIDITQEIVVIMQYEILESNDKIMPYANFHLYNIAGVCVFVSSVNRTQIHTRGIYEAQCILPANFLNQGTYFINIALSSNLNGVHVHFHEINALSFNIRDLIDCVPTRLKINGIVAYSGEIPGVVRPLLNWQTNKLS
jgi:lipopolysaccharide transport system ATP-binding protein